MATKTDSSLVFFSKANPSQWAHVLSMYKEVLRLKAIESRGHRQKGPGELIKLDAWFQEKLPVIISGRKDKHVIHEELVQVTKWKLMRGKHRPRLLDLVRINTELAVLQATKKAFRKLRGTDINISGALTALTNLKGISPATASAVLAAGAPDVCPYMADESMLATPGVEASDYSISEYVQYAEQIKVCTERLKLEDPNGKWTPHKIELCLWTHYVARQLDITLLDGMPNPDGSIPDDGKVKTSEGEDEEEENSNSPIVVPATNGITGVNNILSEDSNASIPNSEMDDKSSDSCLQDSDSKSKFMKIADESQEGNGNGFRHPAGNGKLVTEDTDSKDDVTGFSSEENEENSRNNVMLHEEDKLFKNNSDTITVAPLIEEQVLNLTNSSLSKECITTTTTLDTKSSAPCAPDVAEELEPQAKKLRTE